MLILAYSFLFLLPCSVILPLTAWQQLSAPRHPPAVGLTWLWGHSQSLLETLSKTGGYSVGTRELKNMSFPFTNL